MSNVVSLVTRPRPSRGKQDGIMHTSYHMYLSLADIEGMESHGGAPRAGINTRTFRALFNRGLVACYESYGVRVCLTPIGRNVLRSWRLRLT